MIRKNFILAVTFTIVFSVIPAQTVKEQQLKYKPTKIQRTLTERPTIKVLTSTETHATAILKTENTIQVINILLSFYTSSYEDCGNSKGISASGKNLVQASRGGNAPIYVAAPKSIEFGTQIDVKGLGICQVEDRGGAIKYIWLDGIEYMKLDVFVPGATRKQLLDKGVIKTKGHIIEKQGN